MRSEIEKPLGGEFIKSLKDVGNFSSSSMPGLLHVCGQLMGR
jgi:hypothetical protein